MRNLKIILSNNRLVRLLLKTTLILTTLTVTWVSSARKLPYEALSVRKWYGSDVPRWCQASKNPWVVFDTPTDMIDVRLYDSPLYNHGRYQAAWTEFSSPKFMNIVRWLLFSEDESEIPDEKLLSKYLPVLHLNGFELHYPPPEGIRVTWFGHATALVQFDGISVLTDPIFSERPFPIQSFGPKKRFRSVPGGTLYDLPYRLDAVVISHNHFDHLDADSVETLNNWYGPSLHWFVPMGLRQWMLDTGRCTSVTEMTWWQYSSTPYMPHVQFHFTPAQHWTMRIPIIDTNKVLWGSWVIKSEPSSQRNSKGYSFFFGGDTAYCDAFKLIGQQLGPFDLAAIPIGAYHPRWFFHYQHVDPMDAIRIHKDLKAVKSVGIHWGTFTLTNEFYLSPKFDLERLSKEACLAKDEFFTMNHGETRLISKPIKYVQAKRYRQRRRNGNRCKDRSYNATVTRVQEEKTAEL